MSNFLIFLAVCAACLTSGGLLGFIFGLPRSMERNGKLSNRASQTSSSSAVAPSVSLQQGSSATVAEAAAESYEGWSNNNLIEVSDWLTKIVIGLTLVQFTKITEWVHTNGPIVGTAIGVNNFTSAKVSGICIIVIFFITGFLASYTYTRTEFARLIATSFMRVSDMLQEKLKKAETQVEQLRDEVKSSDRAFSEIVRKLGGDEQVSHALKALYFPAPDSFTLALPILDELVLDASRDDLGYLWTLKAAAYGQRFQYLKLTGADEATQKDVANLSYEAAAKAIAIDPTQRDFLRSIWDPNHPNYSEVEADLRSLYDDDLQNARFGGLFKPTESLSSVVDQQGAE